MLELMEFVKTRTSFAIAEGVGYGPPGSLQRTRAMIATGEIDSDRPQAEWPRTPVTMEVWVN